MRSPLARWKVRHVVGSWFAYWAVLAAATLTPAAITIWKVSRDGAKGDASLALGDGGLHAHVSGPGVTTWDHTIALTTVVLTVVGPPLLLWVCWVLSASRSRNSGEQHPTGQLGSGDELPLRREDRARDAMR
jgi:hypothetical protein